MTRGPIQLTRFVKAVRDNGRLAEGGAARADEGGGSYSTSSRSRWRQAAAPTTTLGADGVRRAATPPDPATTTSPTTRTPVRRLVQARAGAVDAGALATFNQPCRRRARPHGPKPEGPRRYMQSPHFKRSKYDAAGASAEVTPGMAAPRASTASRRAWARRRPGHRSWTKRWQMRRASSSSRRQAPPRTDHARCRARCPRARRRARASRRTPRLDSATDADRVEAALASVRETAEQAQPQHLSSLLGLRQEERSVEIVRLGAVLALPPPNVTSCGIDQRRACDGASGPRGHEHGTRTAHCERKPRAANDADANEALPTAPTAGGARTAGTLPTRCKWRPSMATIARCATASTRCPCRRCSGCPRS